MPTQHRPQRWLQHMHEGQTGVCCIQIRDFEDHFFWLGVYDPPVKIVDRKNEILVYGKHVDHQSPAKHAGPLSKLLSIFLPVK